MLRSSASSRDRLIYEFGDVVPTPEQMAHLVAGLKTHFGEIRITVETIGQVRVIARESNPRLVERMKSFCAGFALLL